MRLTVLFVIVPMIAAAPCSASAQSDGLSSPAPPAERTIVTPGPVASGATCDGGRVASDATLGRCCWPGQTFSTEHARCEGPPTCPDGSSAHGDDCVGADVDLRVRPVSETPRPATSIQHSLVGTGVFFFLAGYTAAAVYGPLFGCDWAGGIVWLVPLAGPLVGSAAAYCSAAPAEGWKWTIAAITTAFQIAGLVMWIVGLADRNEIVLERDDDGAPTLAIELTSTPTLVF